MHFSFPKKTLPSDKFAAEFNPYLSNYFTARLDIRKTGSEENGLELTQFSDPEVVWNRPEWINKDGAAGIVAMSEKGRLFIRLRCLNYGVLTLNLMGLDVRDKDGRRIPFWIDYKSLFINGQQVFSETKSVWHDKPFRCQLNVTDGEEVEIEISWTMHDDRMYNTRLM